MKYDYQTFARRCLVTTLGALAFSAMADYQFIITPDWNAQTASKAKSSSIASISIDLEARYRTWLESAGTNLNTKPFNGTIFLFH